MKRIHFLHSPILTFVTLVIAGSLSGCKPGPAQSTTGVASPDLLSANDYMMAQLTEIRDKVPQTAARMENGELILTLGSEMLFEKSVQGTTVKYENQQLLSDLACIFNKYRETSIFIEGHTDIMGAGSHNVEVSKERAELIGRFMESYGVHSDRVICRGAGEYEPVADNLTEEGRARNRRIEIWIHPSERLGQERYAAGK